MREESEFKIKLNIKWAQIQVGADTYVHDLSRTLDDAGNF